MEELISRIQQIKKDELDERGFYEQILGVIKEMEGISLTPQMAKQLKTALTEIGCMSYDDWKKHKSENGEIVVEANLGEGMKNADIQTAVSFVSQLLGEYDDVIYDLAYMLEGGEKSWVQEWLKNSEESYPKTKDGIGQELTVYKQIARDALMNWNGLSEEEATKKVLESTNGELEQQVYAEGSIDYALQGFQEYSKVMFARRQGYGYGVPIDDRELAELKDFIMNGGKNLEETGIMPDDFLYVMKKNLGFTDDQMFEEESKAGADMVISVLSTIHDGWVHDNQKKFMARDKKYQHMPLELIGWDEAKSDLLFLSPILSRMDIVVREEDLEAAYDERVKEFFKEKGVTEIEDLQGEISQGASFYPALEGQDDVIQALQDPQFVSESVIPSIKAKGVGADKSAMSRIDKWKERGSKLQTARARKQELEQEAQTIERLIDEKENETKNID